MNSNIFENAVEAILFVAGEPVETQSFLEALELSLNDFERLMSAFVDKYNLSERGLKIIKFDNCYQLATRSECVEYLKRFAGAKKANNLSQAAMEVLSIIVYNQPVTRGTIDKIRGVDSFGPLEKLVAREIVEEKGRLDAPGRPILYGTTREFLKVFGLKSLEDVPDISSLQLTMDEVENTEQ